MWKYYSRLYITTKIFLIIKLIKQVEMINKSKFVYHLFNKDFKIFVLFIIFGKTPKFAILIYFFQDSYLLSYNKIKLSSNFFQNINIILIFFLFY